MLVLSKTDLRIESMWMTIKLQKVLAPIDKVKVSPPMEMAETIYEFLSKNLEEPKQEFKIGITNGN